MWAMSILYVALCKPLVHCFEQKPRFENVNNSCQMMKHLMLQMFCTILIIQLHVCSDNIFLYIICYLGSCFKDEEIGGYSIQQNVGGHPVAVFRFPQRVSLPAQKLATVWSGSSDPLLHQPPTDFIFPEQEKWGAGPECTTILTKNTGQVSFASYIYIV